MSSSHFWEVPQGFFTWGQQTTGFGHVHLPTQMHACPCLLSHPCYLHCPHLFSRSFKTSNNQRACTTGSPFAPQIHFLPLPSFWVCLIGGSKQEFRDRRVQQSFYFPNPSMLDCGVRVAVLLYQRAAVSYSNPPALCPFGLRVVRASCSW